MITVIFYRNWVSQSKRIANIAGESWKANAMFPHVLVREGAGGARVEEDGSTWIE